MGALIQAKANNFETTITIAIVKVAALNSVYRRAHDSKITFHSKTTDFT